MKVLALDGTEHTLRLPKTVNRLKSKLHIRAVKLITEIFPFDRIYEEVKIPKSLLFIDIFIPTIGLTIEVHGKQHYERNSFHFKTNGDFLKAKRRDSEKRIWCELNNFDLIELPYNEIENWESLINDR